MEGSWAMAHGTRSATMNVENKPTEGGKSMQIQTLQVCASCDRAVLSVTAPRPEPRQGNRLQADSAANTVP